MRLRIPGLLPTVWCHWDTAQVQFAEYVEALCNVKLTHCRLDKKAVTSYADVWPSWWASLTPWRHGWMSAEAAFHTWCSQTADPWRTILQMRWLARSPTNVLRSSCSRSMSHSGKTAERPGTSIAAEETWSPGLPQELWSRMLWPKAWNQIWLSVYCKSASIVYRSSRSLEAILLYIPSIMRSLKNRLSVNLTSVKYLNVQPSDRMSRWHLALGPLSHPVLWQKVVDTHGSVSNSDL